MERGEHICLINNVSINFSNSVLDKLEILIDFKPYLAIKAVALPYVRVVYNTSDYAMLEIKEQKETPAIKELE